VGKIKRLNQIIKPMEATAEQSQEWGGQIEADRAITQAQADKNQEEQDSQSKESPKMDTMLFAILLILCVGADFVDIMTAGTIGWVVGIFVDAILLLSFGFSKGGRKQFKKMVVGVIGDSIPIVSILPFRSFFLIWSFVQSR